MVGVQQRPHSKAQRPCTELPWGQCPHMASSLDGGYAGTGIQASQNCMPHEDHCCLLSVKPECRSGDRHVPFGTHPFSAGMLL